MVLLSFSIVYGADGCTSNGECTWYAYGVSGEDGVNLSFSYENGSTSGEFEMVSLGSGKYLYNATHNLTGNVLGCARSYNSSETIDTSCESKEIYYNGYDDVIGVSVMNLFWIGVICILLVVLGVLVIVSMKK